jgi:predicted MPP superfamily phosphohydrolase
MTNQLRRGLAIGAFLALALIFLAATHGYLALRLVLDPGWPEPVRSLGISALAVLAALIFVHPIAERALPRPLARFVSWPAAIWMGAFFWLFLLSLAGDVLFWTAGGVARAADASAPGEGAAALRAVLALSITAAAVAAGLRSGLAPPTLRREEFAIARWPRALDGFRIVQISDIHIGPLLGRKFAAHLAQRVNALAPDLVAVTGDLVDGSAPRLAGEVAPFAELRARHGVFFVTGNHDHYSGAEHWSEVVRGLGMRVLRNERVEVGAPGASFDLVGVDDHHAHFAGDGKSDLARALAGRDPERPAVLLAHDPATFARARSAAIDLQLSGHTHGGQIWPFAWFVRLATPYVAGRYRDGRAQLYVSRGTGFWGPPMRLFSPAEITEITLRTKVDLEVTQ